jgi:hypothetical protein
VESGGQHGTHRCVGLLAVSRRCGPGVATLRPMRVGAEGCVSRSGTLPRSGGPRAVWPRSRLRSFAWDRL